MCRRTTCPTCKKPSWAGCGAHVEQVLGDVPSEDRCDCEASASGGRFGAWISRALGG